MTDNVKPFSIFENLSKTVVRQIQHLGIHRVIKPRTHFTSLEQKYYAMLKSMDVFYVPQYELDGRFYDAYLPDYNLLVEFDGKFWHPTSLEECQYDFQRKNFGVDKLKNRIAAYNGHRLLRIREDAPITTAEFRKILKEISR